MTNAGNKKKIILPDKGEVRETNTEVELKEAIKSVRTI